MPNDLLPAPSSHISFYFKRIDENSSLIDTVKYRLKLDYFTNGITPVSANIYQGKRQDNGEPFIDINENWIHPQASRIKIMPAHFKQQMGLPEPELGSIMRLGTFHALLRTVSYLPVHIGLYVYEAYRPLERQRHLFSLRIQKLTQEHPEWTREKVYQETTKLVCPVTEDVIPPHSTGGAVDIWMFDIATGEILPMVKYNSGTVSSAPTFSTEITEDEQKNRQLLLNAATHAGFINYTGEIWHYSIGDGVWAKFTQREACYKGVEGIDIKNKIMHPPENINNKSTLRCKM